MNQEHSVHSGGEDRHEHSDIPVRTIAKFLAGLVVAGVVVVFVLAGLWRYFETSTNRDAVAAWSGPRELPPQPRLQVAPRFDLLQYREREMQRLSSYGWVEDAPDRVHIPIERAMEMIVQRGLPARQAAPQETKPVPKRFVDEPKAQ